MPQTHPFPLPPPRGPRGRVCWAPQDACALLSGAQDGLVKLWDTRCPASAAPGAPRTPSFPPPPTPPNARRRIAGIR